jgi:hypothetical protein
MAFRQGVCGFDILRVHGNSYVCDVNGWSFVKTSSKYFDDCAQLLSEIVRSSVTHKCLESLSAVGPLTLGNRLASRHASLRNMSIEPQKQQRRRRFSMPAIGSKPQPTSFRVTFNTDETEASRSVDEDTTGTTTVVPSLEEEGSQREKSLEKGHLDGEELRCVICVIRHGKIFFGCVLLLTFEKLGNLI